MAKGIWSVHPYCSFGFKCHSVKSIGSKRSGPVFTCDGYCIFDDCPVEVKIKFQEESSLKAEVIFSGDLVCHRWDQIKRRPVRGEERDALSDILSTKLPRTVFLENIERLDDTVVASGCRDKVPTTGVMKTVSWSKKTQKRRHKNEMISLQKIVAEEEAEGEGRVIQNICLYHKSVMLYSKNT